MNKQANTTAASLCAGKTAKGAPCKNKPVPGYSHCRVHMPLGGAANLQSQPQPASAPDMAQVAVLLEKILVELQEIKSQTAPPPEPGPDRTAELTAKLLAFLDEKMEFIKRRIDGDYEVDKWGRDLELLNELLPIGRFLYNSYWRVEATGLENVPAEGRALLVANHSGVVPWDAAMIMMAVLEQHPKPRLVRGLHLSGVVEIPMVGLALARLGQVQAIPENARRLLEEDELALVFPEGTKGVGKPFAERYQLARFGRGGFVRTALHAKAPIIPIAVVGAEEIHPMIYNMEALANLVNAPYAPVTPTFPLLGPLGAIPLPTKWYIHFCEPIDVTGFDHGPSGEPLLVSKISNQVREVIQHTIHERLKKRRAVFW